LLIERQSNPTIHVSEDGDAASGRHRTTDPFPDKYLLTPQPARIDAMALKKERNDHEHGDNRMEKGFGRFGGAGDAVFSRNGLRGRDPGLYGIGG
jgi:hypothetical protein